MSYHPYGAPPYGAPPAYGGFPGSTAAPGMAPPPGLGPPPGMSSAPGMGPPPGVQQANATQANRPSGLPSNFQAPPSMPNINFSAPVIRLGTLGAKPGGGAVVGRKDSDSSMAMPSRPGLGMERDRDQSRYAARESLQALVPPTNEEKLRTIFISKIPDGVGGDEGMERILGAVGKLRRWDPAASVGTESKGRKFGFAQFEDVESLAVAVDVLADVEVPAQKQTAREVKSEDEPEVEKVRLLVTVDQSSTKYLESYKETRDDAAAEARLLAAKQALKEVLDDLFSPKTVTAVDGEGDTAMANGENGLGENVEVVNIPLAQEDELADIPAEMREVVAAEIAAFRDRSNKRDLERLEQEEEMEEQERLRSGSSRPSRRETSPPNSNSAPLGPRGVPNAPLGPRGQNGTSRVAFVNGDYRPREEDDSDASDEELNRRELAKQQASDDKLYQEAERKWTNRERSRTAALEREQERDKQELETFERRRREQIENEKAWDDEREAARKSHPYYRDHAAWARKRAMDRADEEARDDADRRAEQDELRRERAELEQARGMADSFLDQQAREMEQRQQQAAAAAPQPFKLSLGAAAQRAQAQRAAPQRRTVAEVEGLLDDEEGETTARRQLVRMELEPMPATSSMTDEELTKAVRALAQEIPSEKEGLWAWQVQWDHLEDLVIREKLKPFVEKKIMEYLGVQEQMLVEVVEEHLRRHGKPDDLVAELSEAMDDEAEDLVKKLWRMVIFFTECEKRGLPA